MIPLITEHKLPTVVSQAPAPVVYTPVRPTVFTFGATYENAFYAQLKYIHEKMAKPDAVYGLVRQDDDFGKDIEAGFDRAVKDFNLKAPVRIRFKKGTTNFSAEVAQMKQAGVTAASRWTRSKDDLSADPRYLALPRDDRWAAPGVGLGGYRGCTRSEAARMTRAGRRQMGLHHPHPLTPPPTQKRKRAHPRRARR